MQKKTEARLKTGVAGIGWISGLALAGSEGALMPWLNILGVLIFIGSSLALSGYLSALEQKKTHVFRPASSLTFKKGWQSSVYLSSHSYSRVSEKKMAA